MLSSTEAAGLGAPCCCTLEVRGKMLKVKELRGKEEMFLQGRSRLKTQECLHGQVWCLGSPGSPIPGSSRCEAKTATSFSQIWGCRGSNPHSQCFFLTNFRCGLPKDVDSSCLGREGGTESAVAPSPVCSQCPSACSTPARQPARFLAKSWSDPSWKTKWPGTIHKRMFLAHSFAPVIPIPLGFSSAPGPPESSPPG